ncbi:hypothetical protein ES702_06453 [subsurface metagenome]
MKILDVDYFVKGHHTAETYAAAHEVCSLIILDNQNEEFTDPDAANCRIMIEFAVYVNETVGHLEIAQEIGQATARDIGQSLIQDFQFCVSKVDPEIIDDRRQIK